MTELRFDGRVAVITGGGRGQGAVHSRLLAARGASVVVADLGGEVDGSGTRDPGPAEAVVQEIRAGGGAAAAAVADVGDPAAARSIIDVAVQSFGRIDIVINNAGIWQYMPFDEYSPEAFGRDLHSHLWGSWNVAHAAWSHMREQGYGRILNIGSDGMLGFANAAGYCTVKAAITGFTKALAIEGKPLGIQVNALGPSAATRMGALFPKEIQQWRTKYQTPEMVSAGVAWLVHEECSASGGIFSCYSGRIGSFFTAQTHGWWTEPAAITPELVRDNFAQAVDQTQYFVPRECGDSVETVYQLIGLPDPPRPGSLDEAVHTPLGETEGVPAPTQ